LRPSTPAALPVRKDRRFLSGRHVSQDKAPNWLKAPPCPRTPKTETPGHRPATSKSHILAAKLVPAIDGLPIDHQPATLNHQPSSIDQFCSRFGGCVKRMAPFPTLFRFGQPALSATAEASSRRRKLIKTKKRLLKNAGKRGLMRTNADRRVLLGLPRFRSWIAIRFRSGVSSLCKKYFQIPLHTLAQACIALHTLAYPCKTL